MRHRCFAALVFLPLLAVVPPPVAAGGDDDREAKVEGYAEWRHGPVLVVDGQQIRLRRDGKFKGEGEARSFESIPLGYEVKAEGTRGPRGVLLAAEVEAKPNGRALFESEVQEATDRAEAKYRRAGRYYVEDARHHRRKVIGRLYSSGPEVERVRRTMDRLLPPYLEPDRVRVYVIDNREWNAFAMGNFSIYVFSGLLDDMSDDELAIVLGHELVHASHEHTRRQFKKAMWIQIAALGVAVAAERIDDRNKRAVVDLLAILGASVWANGFGRDLEDQADRVGIRYAYEAGYDVSVGPRLWYRFARRYGEPGKAVGFFFSNHSRSTARAQYLERELALNYSDSAENEAQRNARDQPEQAPRPAAQEREPDPERADAAEAQEDSVAALADNRGQAVEQIKPGMAFAEVRKLLGPPDKDLRSGAHAEWVYPEVKIVFRDGRVAEVRY
jgi:hypothetical protein